MDPRICVQKHAEVQPSLDLEIVSLAGMVCGAFTAKQKNTYGQIERHVRHGQVHTLHRFELWISLRGWKFFPLNLRVCAVSVVAAERIGNPSMDMRGAGPAAWFKSHLLKLPATDQHFRCDHPVLHGPAALSASHALLLLGPVERPLPYPTTWRRFLPGSVLCEHA